MLKEFTLPATVCCVLPLSVSWCGTATTTQSLSLQLAADVDITAPGSASLTSSGTTFNTYTGTVSLNYRARVTTSTGNGSITVQASADFSPSGGPSVAAANLTYTCGAPTLGTGCSGTQAVSTTSSAPVLSLPAGACTGGGGACSSANPNTIQLNLVLANKPAYKTGSYTIQLTFNMSSI